MTFDECAVGVRVVDRWFGYWGIGTIKKIVGMRVHIQFSAKLLMQEYDVPHLQFLELYDEKKN